jgi:hypothetical protein
MLALNRFHLIFEAELQLLEAYFLEFLVFAEVPFLGEYFEALRVLRVLLSQLAEFLVARQELVFRSQHPADLQPGYGLKVAQHKNMGNA